jgi:hypothetical protein
MRKVIVTERMNLEARCSGRMFRRGSDAAAGVRSMASSRRSTILARAVRAREAWVMQIDRSDLFAIRWLVQVAAVVEMASSTECP